MNVVQLKQEFQINILNRFAVVGGTSRNYGT